MTTRPTSDETSTVAADHAPPVAEATFTDHDGGPVSVPFTARRMLLSGSHAPAVAEGLAKELPDLETRVVAPGEVADEDLTWADSYAGPPVPSAVVSSGVRWVHSMAAGVHAIAPALADARAEGRQVVLTRTVGQMPRFIGTYVLTHLLAELHHLREYREQQSSAQWRALPHPRPAGKTVVVLGTGEIGAGISSMLRATGFRVLGVNTRGSAAPGFDSVTSLADAGPHLGRCVALVCALPLTDETRGLVDGAVLEQLDGAVVINIGRGASLDTVALRGALETGRVRHAVLDVFETEPLPAEDWRWSHPQVTVTPHVSGPTEPEDVVEAIVAARSALAQGRRPSHTVDLTRGY